MTLDESRFSSNTTRITIDCQAFTITNVRHRHSLRWALLTGRTPMIRRPRRLFLVSNNPGGLLSTPFASLKLSLIHIEQTRLGQVKRPTASLHLTEFIILEDDSFQQRDETLMNLLARVDRKDITPKSAVCLPLAHREDIRQRVLA
jgi:hypothetical protein